MKITLILVGKTEEEYLKQGIEMYVKRLKHYINFTTITIPALKNNKNLTIEQQKQLESEQILKNLSNTDRVIFLSEEGKALRSIEFSNYLAKAMVASVGHMVFVIGGPFGADERVRKRADMILSLSNMTFSHQMVRLFFVEQLYRAMTIMKNEPYHHE